MTPERWQQIRDLLHEAMQLDAEKRPAFLEQHRANDPTLREDGQTAGGRHKLKPQLLTDAARWSLVL